MNDLSEHLKKVKTIIIETNDKKSEEIFKIYIDNSNTVKYESKHNYRVRFKYIRNR